MPVCQTKICTQRTAPHLQLDQCEPGLGFWLVEELLDTQTIDGCRVVFDYLESRRERMCAVGQRWTTVLSDLILE